MKNFEEVYNEIKGSIKVSKSGKLKKTFSRTDFDKLLKALANDTEYKTEYYGTKNGEPVPSTVYPVKMFRESIKKVLMANGVDSQEAAKFVTDYQFTNVDGWYELMSEIIYKFMEAGKKFDFPTRQDFKGSIAIKENPESVGTFSSIQKDANGKSETFKVKTKAHKTLEKKSKAPQWLKAKFK